MPAAKAICVWRLGLGFVLLGMAGCAGAPPPEAFERAQAATAARLAAGTLPPVIASQRTALASAPSRPVAAHRAPPAATADAVTAADERGALERDPRERQMRQVMRSICPTCLGPEPVFFAGDAALRAARLRQLQAESAERRRRLSEPSSTGSVGSLPAASPPTVLPDPSVLTPVSAAPVPLGWAVRLPGG
jgi:hypothetical protein